MEISLSLGQQLAVLAHRAKKLRRVSHWATAGAGAGLLLAVIFFILAWAAEPSSTLAGIHLPEELLKQFSDAASGGDGGSISASGVGPLGDVAVNLAQKLAGFGQVIGVLSIVIGFALGVVRQSMGAVMSSLIMGMTLTMAPSILNVATGGGASSLEAGPSPRAVFEKTIKDEKWAEAIKSLEGLEEGGGPAGKYVLAQILVHQNKGPLASEALRGLESHSKKLALAGGKPSVFYALDLATWGAPRAPTAISYEAGAVEASEQLESASMLFGRACAAMSLIALLFGGVWLKITGRVDRVRAIANSHGFEIGEEALPELVRVEQSPQPTK